MKNLANSTAGRVLSGLALAALCALLVLPLPARGSRPRDARDALVPGALLAHARILSVASQPDGRILAVGCQGAGNSEDKSHFLAVRYTRGGFLDPTFGSDGIATPRPTGRAGAQGCATQVSIQSSGRILIAGTWTLQGKDSSLAVLRLTSSGRRDISFGTGGIASLSPDIGVGGGFPAFAITRDQIVLGSSMNVDGESLALLLAGFDANGKVDAAFGDNGKLVTSLGHQSANPQSMTAQRDGKLVVTASVRDRLGDELGPDRGVVARLKPDGSLDASFASGGVFTGAPYTQFANPSLYVDNRMLFDVGPCGAFHPCLARLRADGTLDKSFSGDGYAYYRQISNVSATILGPVGGDTARLGVLFRPNHLLVATVGFDGSIQPMTSRRKVGSFPRIDVSGGLGLGLRGTTLVTSSREFRGRPTAGITRLARNAQLDKSFGAGGFAVPVVATTR